MAQTEITAEAQDASEDALYLHDWNEEWKALQVARKAADREEFWDKRAETFTTSDSPNSYVAHFLELAAISPDESVFDMGCGTGALSIPLAKQGSHVVARDFSQGMLNRLLDRMEAEEVIDIDVAKMSWEDDWSQFGLAPNCVDVAIASRSIAVMDLEKALLRLNEVARKRVCLTICTEHSPRLDPKALELMGVPISREHDHQYVFNILTNLGINARVSYIESVRWPTFDTIEEGLETYHRMIEDAVAHMSPEKQAKAHEVLDAWLPDNLEPNPEVGKLDDKGIPQKTLRSCWPRTVTWAFISWDVKQG